MKKPVLVVGGGIAGIQASLDLAGMGVPVYIVESTPSIGGRMAQLDKTFPTNDCSACILAPKVTECYNHPLIKTFTYSELLAVKGDVPDFTAVVRKKARFINEDLCKGCSDCTLVCPIESRSEFDMGLSARHAIYKPYAQAVPNKVVIEKKGTSPCKYRCPAHINAHGYIALTGKGRYEEALKLVRDVTPLAGVLGRVCAHPCESKCSRRFVDEPVAVASLKRFIADEEIRQGKQPRVKLLKATKNRKVAVIGSGPAGISCAYKLALNGFGVTVFEAMPKPGGMMRYGIPGFKLDKGIMEREIGILGMLGVEIKCSTPVGSDLKFEDLRKSGYEAFFIGIGAQKDAKLSIPGEDLKGVFQGIEFLKAVNQGEMPALGKRVIVAGGVYKRPKPVKHCQASCLECPTRVCRGADTAILAARSAVRLGCDVTVVYRRPEKELPANIWEYEEALKEGVRFEFSALPIEVTAADNGKVSGLKCTRVRADGGIETFVMPADSIIAANGQSVDSSRVISAGGPQCDKNGNVKCGKESSITDTKDIFAGGDAVTGPSSVIDAIASGNRAAMEIMNYLEGTAYPVEPQMLPETPAEAIDLSGFTASQRHAVNMIDTDRRMNTFDEAATGLTEEQARIEAQRCVDCSVCSECMACETACLSGAIRHTQADETLELQVSSVIIANGYDTSRNIPDGFGYGKYRNVVTSLEYERILSASGPFQGHVHRPSDGKPPKRIAFVQCAGSRDVKCGSGYCSSVCCMYAVKEAIITKEHLPSVKEIDIYYMDMRAFGKDFDKYVELAKEKYGIRFIRGRISGVESGNSVTGKSVAGGSVTGRTVAGESVIGGSAPGDDSSLIISYAEENGPAGRRAYDMVVLSVGLRPNGSLQPVLEDAGVKHDKYGFCWIDELRPPHTTKEGIIACGVAAGPKDIPETVIEAGAAASEAGTYSFGSEADLAQTDLYFKKEIVTQLRDVSCEPLRIGVFVCRCGVNIAGFLDVDAVTDYARTLPFVEYSGQSLYACSVDSQRTIAEKIAEYGLNRVVVASCTPRTHEALFQSAVAKAGLNPYLFTMANIRDQCSWVHMDRWDDATAKAKDLVRMAVGKVTYARPLEKQRLQVEKSALVIGGGMAGMASALELAGMGYRVHLIEKSGCLGGNALKLSASASGRPYHRYIDDYIAQVLSSPLIDVHLNTEISNIEGYVGNYTTSLKENPACVTDSVGAIRHGVVIIATGANEEKPSGRYLYGSDRRIVTQLELEEGLSCEDSLNSREDYSTLKNVVMIQCAGSRNNSRPYCSRVCCNQAVRNALALKHMNPAIKVTILYRDIRTYGLNELNYRNARKAGIRFIRYEQGREPQAALDNAAGELRISVYEPILEAEISLPADLLVLAGAIAPDAEANRKIAQMLKVPLNQDGFFLEAHVKLRPVDFATEGVFLCGLAHSPKNLRESIVQGKAAAARAAAVISRDALQAEGTIARVNEALCSGCGDCERVCAYKAVSVAEKKKRDGSIVRKASVNSVLCKGCGTCTAGCRCGAIDIDGFNDRQVSAELDCFLAGTELI